MTPHRIRLAGLALPQMAAAQAWPGGLALAFAVLPTLISHCLDPARHAPGTRAEIRAVALHHQALRRFGLVPASLG
jgi:hypothetical protein